MFPSHEYLGPAARANNMFICCSVDGFGETTPRFPSENTSEEEGFLTRAVKHL